MTGKQRMRAAILGEPVDRVPIWLREGFDFHLPIPDADDFSRGWRADPDYVALWEFAREHCDMRVGWTPGGHLNRTLGITPTAIESRSEVVDDNTRRTHTTVHTPQGELTGIRVAHRGEVSTWSVKYPVETMADLEALRSVPFEVVPVDYRGHEREYEQLGDRGVMCLGISSPWVVFSTCTRFEQALMWSITDPGMVHEVLGEITDRILACLSVVFERPLDTMANIGGAEQCTPPMMSPDAYAEFVTPYETRIVAFLKGHGVPVNCHCHGRVSGALGEMIAAGYDSTDPVEPPDLGGDGDATMAQAREITGDRLTLCGNFQFEELERSTPEQIRARVTEMLDTGKERLVLSASAGPTAAVSKPMLANYRAWIEEAVSLS
ncbi:MAG: uroporphyrinogen decarboxylase family protein [Candidatus Latescibacteria bacterium]|jgi:hypothetical protein|nr:uroporphyrinogen decarboxylase family protein [Candidatus Latescibacterota bacterium]